MRGPSRGDLRGAGLLALALALCAGALLVVRARLEPPPALGVEASPEGFSAGRAMAVLRRLIGDGVPHPVGSAASAALRERLLAEFAALGVRAEVQEGFACGPRSATCGRVWNVVGVVPGAQEGPALLVSAHYDSVASGPGAGDDGAGVAAALEVARALRAGAALPRPVVFVLVDGEEAGLLGAQAFVDAHPLAETIACVINLDAGGTRGVTSLTRTTGDNAALVAAVAASVPRPYGASVIGAVYGLTPYDTDFTVYRNAGWAGLDFGFGEDKAHYHTPLDRLDNLDARSVQHLGDTALASVRSLAGLDLGSLPTGSRVYLDVLGAVLVHWPTLLTPALALLGLAVLGWRARRAGGRAGRRLWALRGLAFPVLVGVPAAVGAALGSALAWAVGAEVPGHAAPEAARAAVWAGVLASSGAIAGWLGRVDRAWRAWLWLGPWLWLAVIGAGTAVGSPGASVGVLPPVLVTAAGAAFGWRKGQVADEAGPRAWAVLLCLVLPALMWLQAAVRVEAIFGIGGTAAGVVALLAALLAPLWAGLGRLRRWVVGALVVVVAAAFAVALGQEPYSADRPRRLSVLYHLDADSGAGRWIVGADAPLPPQLASVASFGAAGRAFAWDADDSESFVAPASGVAAPAPEVTIEDGEVTDEGRTIRLRLRSQRGARIAALLVPESAGVRAVRIEGRELPAYPEHRREVYVGVEVYGVVALPAEGVRVELDVAASGPVESVVWDLSEGLPEEGEALRSARPGWAVPSHGGDRTMVSRAVTL